MVTLIAIVVGTLSTVAKGLVKGQEKREEEII